MTQPAAPATPPPGGPGSAAAGHGAQPAPDVAAPGAPAAAARLKIPESVLVVIYTPALQVLVLERADHPGFWQSVTGSKDSADEPLAHTCRREVMEETGIDAARHRLVDWSITNRYEIYPHWRHRYPDGVTHNTEHVFGLEVPEQLDVRLAPREHLRYAWLPWREAADRCFSWSNVEAIRELPRRAAAAARDGAAPPPVSDESGR